MCGAFGGEVTGPTKYNKRGQFENTNIRQNIVKPYLVSIGCDPLGQWPLPDVPKLLPRFMTDSGRLRRAVTNVMLGQGYKGQQPWYYKGAKMASSWPLWQSAFPKCKWIIVRRKDKDIANSCMKTAFMRAFDTTDGWQKWIDEHKARFDEMTTAGLDIYEVWPQKIVNNDLSEIKWVIDEIGLIWNEQAVRDFVSPALWSASKKRRTK